MQAVFFWKGHQNRFSVDDLRLLRNPKLISYQSHGKSAHGNVAQDKLVDVQIMIDVPRRGDSLRNVSINCGSRLRHGSHQDSITPDGISLCLVSGGMQELKTNRVDEGLFGVKCRMPKW
ncbi:hypothetical protein NPIL_274671 [Nephila pilipes]|uniref:Uncharacterized protein n=1 Tax=Nephila pilipes TaxID=299642 RepID=A0A8X6NMA1_NEPPI|nr:hypothetical protein NPIL_274671 [Nephila pilipes]